MDLQLKNVKFSEHMSEETNAFTSDVYFRGQKVGYAKNDGHGGCTNVMSYGLEKIEQFNEAVVYCKTLPKIDLSMDGDKPYLIDSNLENQVDNLFEAWLIKKEITRKSNKGIYYLSTDGNHYLNSWKGFTIAKLKTTPKGKEVIQLAVSRIILKGGIILNTNLKGFRIKL